MSFWADEANPETHDKFAVCCACGFSDVAQLNLAESIKALRRDRGFTPGDQLKFATNSRPAHINQEIHADMKREVIELARKHRVVLLSYAKFNLKGAKFDRIKNVKFGMNTIVGQIEKYCRDNNSMAHIHFDRLDKWGFEYIKEKFSLGNTFDGGHSWRPFSRILSTSMSCDGTSHLASVNDILTGAFRYVVNEPGNSDMRRELFRAILPIMWNNNGIYREYGFILRPKKRAGSTIDEKHQDLRNYLASELRKYASEAENTA